MTTTDGARRSWTESLANSIFVDGIDSVAYLHWLSERESWDNHLVVPFLHEFTHHWCFNSLVGNAVAFAELRLHAMSGRFPKLRGYCARLSLTLSTLTMLLRPIAEGLALFAEFDLDSSSNQSQKFGTPLTAAEVCFARESGNIFSTVMLGEIRRSPEVIDRKASIYLNNFEIDEGYLSGYMLIKWLYLQIQAKVPNMETETFLAYIRCFFWEDPGLVRLMHSGEEEIEPFVRSLISHVARRIDQLRLSTDMPERVEEFWKSWSRPGQFHAGYGLFVAPDDEALALSQAQQAVDDAAHFLMARGVEDAFVPVSEVVWLTTHLANLRRFVVVARCTTEVEKTDDGYTFNLLSPDGSSRKVVIPCLGAIAPGRQELFAVISNFAEYLVLVVKSDTKIQLVNMIGSFEWEKHGANLCEFIEFTDRASSCIDVLRQDFEERGYPSIRARALELALKWAGDSVLDLYLKLMTMRGQWNTEVAAKEEEMLRTNGVRNLFAEDPLALRTFAAASIANWFERDLHLFDFDAQITFIQFFYLSDENCSDIRDSLNAVLARDVSNLISLNAPGFLRIIV